MTLRTKFVLLLVAFTAFLVGSVASAAWAIGLYLDASVTQFATASGLIEEVNLVGDDLKRSIHECLQSDAPPEVCVNPQLNSVIDDLIVKLDRVSPAGQAPSFGQLLAAACKTLTADYARLHGDLRVAPPEGDARRADFEDATVDKLLHDLAEIKSMLSRRAQAAAAAADTVQRNVLVILGLNTVGGVILAVVGALMVQRWVTRPIQALRDASVRFAEGDLEHRVRIQSRDELGMLSQQVNDMARRLAESQRRLVERERMAAVGEVCSAVAHGIRNPLSAIASSAELILSRNPVDDQTKTRILDVLTESARLNQRISRLLDFARTTQIAEEVIRVDELLDQAATEMGPVLKNNGVRLKKRFASCPLYVRGDREMLVNTVIELITNAAEQPSDNPTVMLGCDETKDGVIVEVRDNGPGFSSRALPRVFDLFYTTKANGSGIGLASVRKAVEMHDGKVHIESAERGGAVVTFVLPRVHGAEENVR